MNCDGCKTPGLCCSFSILESKTMYLLPNYHCKFLDKETKQCTIYEDRFKINPECGSMEVMIEHGGMPPKCNYHQLYGFRYKTKVASPKTEKRLWKKIKKKWKEVGVPFSYDKEKSHAKEKR